MNYLEEFLAGDHLTKARKSYWEHFSFAMYGGALLFYAAFASIVHGIFPRLFPFTSARLVMKLSNHVRRSHSYDHL